MGIVGEKWRCPICNADVGGNIGELRHHLRKVHSLAKSEMNIATAA